MTDGVCIETRASVRVAGACPSLLFMIVVLTIFSGVLASKLSESNPLHKSRAPTGSVPGPLLRTGTMSPSVEEVGVRTPVASTHIAQVRAQMGVTERSSEILIHWMATKGVDRWRSLAQEECVQETIHISISTITRRCFHQ